MHPLCATSTAVPRRDGRDHARPKNGPQSRPVERAARALVGTAQERKQATACHGSEDINDRDQNGHRRPYAKAEEGYTDSLKVLESEDYRRGDEQDDDRQIDPAHSGPPIQPLRVESV